VHVGPNGQWRIGQRWQTVQKQRGVGCKQPRRMSPGCSLQLFLDIEGANTILFASEDGLKWMFVLARNKEFAGREGPAVKVKAGQLPAAFEVGLRRAAPEVPTH
jgi:hypothetical protein